MKAKVKFFLEIEVEIKTQKDENESTIMDLNLKASNLGNSLFDTLKHMDTQALLRDKTNIDYRAYICNVQSLKPREIVI
jgi:hypothetical protein